MKGKEKRTAEKERMSGWRRRFRYFSLRLRRLKGEPDDLAWGMAIGVFIGITPTVPLHMALAVLIAFILRKSKLAAALGVWVANPFFLPFIYLLDYKIGQLVTGSSGPSLVFADFSMDYLLKLGWKVYYPMLIGGLMIGFLSSIPTFLLTKKALVYYRNKRRKRASRIDYAEKTT